MNKDIEPPSKQLDAILALSEHDFLVEVFEPIMGRPLDSHSQQLCEALLRKGVSRLKIIASLAQTEEAGAFGGNAPWISEALEISQIYNRPIRRMLFGGYYGEYGLRQDLRSLMLRIDELAKKVDDCSLAARAANVDEVSGMLSASEELDERMAGSMRRLLELQSSVSADSLHREGGASTSASAHVSALELEMKMARPSLPLSKVLYPDLRERLDDYIEGAYSPENHGSGAVRWTKEVLRLRAKISGPSLLLSVSALTKTKFKLLIDGQMLPQLTQVKRQPSKAEPMAGSDVATIVFDVSAYEGQSVQVEVRPHGVHSPFELGINEDQRKLGLLVHEIYCE